MEGPEYPIIDNLNILKELRNDYLPGPDDLHPAYILRETATDLAPILTAIALALSSVLHLGFTFKSSLSLASSLRKIKSPAYFL